GVVMRGAAGQSQVANALQILQSQLATARPLVVLRGEQEQALPGDGLLVDAAHRLTGGDEAEIGLTQPQDLETATRRVRWQEAKIDLRMFLPETNHRVPHEVAHRGSARRDGERIRLAML